MLARGVELSFDGVEMLASRHHSGAEGVAARVAERLGLRAAAGRRDDALRHVMALLEAGLEAAGSFLLQCQFRRMRFNKRWLEDDEQEEPWKDPEEESLPFGLASEAESYLENNPGAAREALEAHLRVRLRVLLAEKAEITARFEALGPNWMLRAAGADDATIERSDLRSMLQAELDRRPLAERLERLMMTDVEELFLMTLTRRFEEENPGGAGASLAAYLRMGMRRRGELIARVQALGRTSCWVALRSYQMMDVADFEAIERVIEEVAVRAAEFEAAGSPFLPFERQPPPPRRRRGHLFGFRPFESERRHVARAVEAGEPVRRARAQAELGRKLVTDPGDVSRSKRRAQLKEAIACWRDAMTVWPRDEAPRKWGALMHNVALAQEALGELDGDPKHHRRALDTIEQAIEAFSPEAEPWCHAAAWAPRFRLEALVARG
jgi:hypothetical protein